MEATARQGLSLTLPQQDRAGAPAMGDVVALQAPARESAWPVEAETVVHETLLQGAPVSLVILRVEERRPSRMRRHPGHAPSVAELVRRWRGDLRSDERLVGLGTQAIGLLLPHTGLDDAFSRVDALRAAAGRTVTVTAAVAASRDGETLAETSLRAERKLARFARAGTSALAV